MLAQDGRVVEKLKARFPEAAILLSDAADELFGPVVFAYGSWHS